MRIIIVLAICSLLIWTFSETTEKKLDKLISKADHYYEIGRYNEALPLYKRALAITEKKFGPDHPETAVSLNNLALLYKETGRYGEAEPLYKRALTIKEKALGPDHPSTSISLSNLGDLYRAVGRYGEVEPLYKRALVITEKESGSDHPDTASSLNSLALLYEEIGRYGEAESLYKRALTIKEKALSPDHPSIATSLNNLAGLYKDTGSYSEAESLYKRSLAIREKALGPKHSDTASSLNNLGGLYKETGRYGDAVPLYKRALAIREKALGPDHPDTATCLHNLAGMYDTIGRYSDAELLYKRALSINEKTFGPDHPTTATSYNNLAGLYKDTGRYSEAESLYKRALSVSEKTLGADHPDTATSLNNLAVLYGTTGRYSEAELLNKRALTIREKVFGPDHPKTATSLNNLGELYRTISRYREAEPLYKRALAIKDKKLGPDHPDTATIINNLAVLYNEIGRYREAEPLYKRALAITEKSLGPDHPDTATSLNNLAGLYKNTGRYSKAEPLIRKSLNVFIKTDASMGTATAFSNYSWVLSSRQSLPAAIIFAKQAVNILQALRKNVSGISREALKSFDKSVEYHYQHLVIMLLSQGRLAEAQQILAMLKEEEYFEFIRRDAGTANKLSTRASYLASEKPWISKYDAISAHNTNLKKDLDTLRAKAKQYPLIGDEKHQLEKLAKEVEQSAAAFNEYIDHLLKLTNQETRANPDHIEDIGAKQIESLTTIKSILRNLGEGSALLHYMITDKRLYIILTTPNKQIVRYSIINSKAFNHKIFVLRNALTNTKTDPRPLAKELYDIILAPVAKDLRTTQANTLMLSLDGPLRYLPFGALYDGHAYVAESYRTVMYAEVARDKVALPSKQQWKVAALGVSDKVSADFPPLPNVPAELHAIVKSSTGGIFPGEIRLNKNFTEKTMAETSIRNPVVHIASHFRFVPGTDRDSFLLLGDGSKLSLDQLRKANFFQESELLTLSACETAMGGTGKGVEIEGFAAIAMNQGAKSVIATLWPISDKSTAILMKEFYRLRMEKKLSKAEALRQAQLELLKGKLADADNKLPEKERGGDHTRFKKDKNAPYSHPYYWAPFILIGNWK